MSPSDTEKKGDLNELPGCAPEGLKDLRTAAEGIIQDYYHLLGSGNPSKAPDPQKVFQAKGVANPDQQATMLDNYDSHEENVEKVKTDYEAQDDGVSVTTGGVGDAIKNAHDAMDKSVDRLNGKIDAAHDAVVTEEHDDGTTSKHLPDHTIQTVFDGIWEALDETYAEVSGVSDKAAEEALSIVGDERTYNQSPYNDTPPGSYPTGGPGDAVATPASYSPGTAIVSTEDEPTAFAMMEYLINEHGFTPAQAAGIVANAKFESGFDVEATGDSGTAHGLFQWRFGRHQGLLDFAGQQGEDLGDWRTHIDYMVREMNGGSYNDAARVVNNDNSSAAAVARAFDEDYEISSGHTTADRESYADDLLNKWKAAKGDTASQPSTDTSVVV
ncbi:phage tail tip lysozyme [Nocardia flavorosea]|uniref:Phage tail lysozyme domain-containing protein n=1 Tax=Nocardia flavorosea TaxID=53429 RepID=A0A846YB31_9NOCA|nr:phage tail tip lysozyme [Nocardia flavorosea]NKY56816.1 hypothetical protein [Nocardia flavorosea]